VGRKQKPKRVPRLTREQSLSTLPVRNSLVEFTHTESGETEITIPRRTDVIGKLLAMVFFIPKKHKIVLESIGTDVWDLCDGEHNVDQISDALVKKYKLNRREAEASLTEYLRRLAKRRLIAFAIPKDVLEKKDK
jgi:hypothetical protein